MGAMIFRKVPVFGETLSFVFIEIVGGMLALVRLGFWSCFAAEVLWILGWGAHRDARLAF
jgi:hypothetical protein